MSYNEPETVDHVADIFDDSARCFARGEDGRGYAFRDAARFAVQQLIDGRTRREAELTRLRAVAEAAEKYRAAMLSLHTDGSAANHERVLDIGFALDAALAALRAGDGEKNT